MRILLAADQYPEFHNGAGAATERLAGGLAARGHTITVVYPAADGRRSRRLHDGRHEERLTSILLPRGQGVRVCLPTRAAREVAEVLRSAAPEVVHVQSHFLVGRVVTSAARRAGVPVVATNHFMPENLLPHVPAPTMLRRRLGEWAWRDLARAFRQAELLTTPTDRAAQVLAERTSLPPARVVSNGIDLHRFSPAALAPFADRPGHRVGGDDPFVLFVGRLEEEKRVDDLLRAFASLPRSLRSRLVFIGTGSRGPLLHQLARDFGVTDRVEFWGNVDDETLRQAYGECAVFCAPGIAELQSLVTLEAIASGAPVVAADAVALPHLVHHARNGYLYPPEQPEQLTAHLLNVLTSPALRHRMGAESRRIAQTHDLSATLDAYLDCYQEVTREPRRLSSTPTPAFAA